MTDEVTDAMCDAGRDVQRTWTHDLLTPGRFRAIYLAMEAARIPAPAPDVVERASDTRYIEACLEELADPAWVPNRNVWRDLCEAALTAIPIPAPTGEDAPTRDDWNWLFKSVERGLFDKATSAKGALLVLANYPGAPWKMGRWNVDHKPYAVEFYKHFPRAALTDHTTKGAE